MILWDLTPLDFYSSVYASNLQTTQHYSCIKELIIEECILKFLKAVIHYRMHRFQNNLIILWLNKKNINSTTTTSIPLKKNCMSPTGIKRYCFQVNLENNLDSASSMHSDVTISETDTLTTILQDNLFGVLLRYCKIFYISCNLLGAI